MELGGAFTLDTSGNVYVTGHTFSTNFPTTNGAYDTSQNGSSDVFVSKLDSGLTSLLASTYLGGADYDPGHSLALGTSGNVYVTGYTYSTDFPATSGAYDTSQNGSSDVFVSKLNSGLTSLLASTYLGGADVDRGNSLALGTSGNVYVSGHTGSTDFPTTSGAYDASYNGGDVFVSKFYLPQTSCEDDGISVTFIMPESGGDTGSVSVIINGCNFTGSSTVKLAKSGETDIAGDTVGVDDGKTIFSIFDLKGKARGAWDVIVINPDSSSVTLPGAFTIEEGRTADVWVDIIARSTVMAGRQQTFTILFGNRGNVNAIGVPLWIAGIPRDVTWELKSKIITPPIPEDENPIYWDWNEVPLSIDTDEETLIPLLIPIIPPNFKGAFKIKLTIPSTRPPIQIRASTNIPYFGSPMTLDAIDCWAEVIKVGTEKGLEKLLGKVLPMGCLAELGTFAVNGFTTVVEMAVNENLGDTAISLSQVSVGSSKVAMACAEDAVKSIPLVKIVSFGIEAVSWGLDVYGVYEKCKSVAVKQSEVSKDVSVVTSRDPNEKTGMQGIGELHYISGEQPLNYTVYFENVGTATAAAQEITITDQLGTATADMDTFSFGTIAFGDWEATPVQGLSEYSTEVDLRPDRNVTVRINAALDKDTGLVIWHLVAVDPDTGEFPEDPSVGILPPNVTSPEGEGNVLFTVMPKDGLATGTEVRNKSKIIFDVNEPIVTNEWMNTIDNDKPSSNVLPLAATQYSATFDVQWTGSDNGSGIKDYTLYVSTNVGSYTAWLSNETGTSTTITGQPGYTYAFYTVVCDETGNTEEAPTEPDATTRIDESVVVPTPTPSIEPTPTVVASPSPEPTSTYMPTPTPVVSQSPTPQPSPTEPPTAVSLVSFKAKINGDGSVTLAWETASEVDNAGFNIYRSKRTDGTYKKVNGKLIPAQGNGSLGASYSYEDTPGKGTFYYKLEDVDENGVSAMHGPVKVRVRIAEGEARRRR